MRQRTLIALDIDSVLNTYDDVLLMANTVDVEVVMKFKKEVKFFLPHDGNKRTRDLGMFVNRKKLALLNSIIDGTDSDIMGISSWFGGGRDDISIATFLGIPLDRFIISEATGGGRSRVRAVAKLIQDDAYDRLLILDDQLEYWSAYKIAAHRAPIYGDVGLTMSIMPDIKRILNTPVDKAKILLQLT